MKISETYCQIAEKIIGEKIVISKDPKAEIILILKEQYQLIDSIN